MFAGTTGMQRRKEENPVLNAGRTRSACGLSSTPRLSRLPDLSALGLDRLRLFSRGLAAFPSPILARDSISALPRASTAERNVTSRRPHLSAGFSRFLLAAAGHVMHARWPLPPHRRFKTQQR